MVLLNVSKGSWWFYWTTIGWGIGLAFHFYATFISSRLLGVQWEEKRRKELEKQYGNNTNIKDLEDIKKMSDFYKTTIKIELV